MTATTSLGHGLAAAAARDRHGGARADAARRRRPALRPQRGGDGDGHRQRPVDLAQPAARAFTIPWTAGPVTSFTRAAARPRPATPARRSTGPEPLRRSRARAGRGSSTSSSSRSRSTAPAPGHGAVPTLTPIPSTTWSARLGEDAGHLAAVDEDVVRLLDRAPSPIAPATARGGDERQLRPARDGRRRPQDDREREPGAGLVDPDPAEPAAALGLVLGERHGAVRRVVGRELLRRRRLGRVVVRRVRSCRAAAAGRFRA